MYKIVSPSAAREPNLRVSVSTFTVTAALLFALASAVHADAPNAADDDDYSLTSWDQAQGLPSGRIRAITQDATGYLWLATESGLVRFDGVRFVRWTPDDGSALSEDVGISALYPASDGSLWLGFYAGGVGRIRNGRLELYGKAAGFGRTRVMFVVQDAAGAIWAGNQDGIYRFGGTQWEPADARFGLPDGGASDAYQDSHHNFWIATGHGIYERLANQSTFIHVDDLAYVVRFSEDANGRMWVTDPNDAFTPLDALDKVRRHEHPGSGFVIIHDTHDTMWLGTLGRGLWRVRHDDLTNKTTVRRITVAEGLSSDIVRSVFEDRDGNVWVGTESGLHRFRRRRIKTKPGIEYGWAAQSTPDGSVWVATTNGVLQFNGESRRRFSEAEGLPSSFSLSLFVDSRGTLWVGTLRGVARKVGKRFEALPLGKTHLPRVISVAADSRGRVWMVDRELGAFVWDNGHLSPLITPRGTSGGDVNLVYVDRQDRLWLGFQGATLACIDAAGNTKLYAAGDRIGSVLTAVYEDWNGAIWIGGTRGVARLSEGRLDAISQPTDFPGQGVFAITGDSRGHIWLGVSSGIIRLTLSEFDRATRPPRSRLVYRFYDASDGLVGVPAHGGFPGATRASDGELWFTTSRGVSVIKPADLDEETPSPTLRIERVRADDRPVLLAQNTVLPAGTSRLLFEYASLNLTSPRKDRFQYELEGVDADWVDAGSRREVFYPNLRSGTYRFHVARIADEQGPQGATATLEFSIQPMYYETWWFIGGCVALVALAGWTAWQTRVRQLRHQFAMVFAERARVGRELHDTLLQELVGVALHFDELAASLEEPQGPAITQIVRLRRYLERSIQEAREAIWDLRSGNLEGQDLPCALRDFGERTFEDSSARFELTVVGTPRPCAPATEKHLLRIAREALSNAARHAHATLVRLSLEYGEDLVTLRISDDGCGCQTRDCHGEVPGHYGFQIMKERAEQARGQLHVETGHGHGTRIEVAVPALHP